MRQTAQHYVLVYLTSFTSFRVGGARAIRAKHEMLQPLHLALSTKEMVNDPRV